MDLLDKLSKCVSYNDILMLSEDFYANGLSIQRTNSNKIVLCLIDENGKVNCNKLFEDFILLTQCGQENDILPEKTLSNVIEFVRNNVSNNTIKCDNQTIYHNSFYGTAISNLAICAESEKSMIEEMKKLCNVGVREDDGSDFDELDDGLDNG